ncbi:hypothetical protein NEMIN01_0530 [Nematocida minor]|uniref:uncharacterized protein n=1 Tax=Nematocida minor TaxID=1912983 RepID=UPI00221E70D1|nr:uncharacterized protein NEMIN01_0530 [Nematocida minor]KAI5189467.1 hypothetical protein NEMIN01_0530 [Nematocida minor]
MQECTKDLDIINSILEDSGILRYNAIKNRFKNEYVDSPTLLCFYKRTQPKDTGTTAIDMYRTNLQKLRRKIEERRVKITETTVNGVLSQEVTECSTIKNEEIIQTVSPNGTATPLIVNTVPIKDISIDNVSSLDDFRYASISGSAFVNQNKKKYAADLKLEGNILTTTITDRKKKTQSVVNVDVTLAKMFLVIKNSSSFLGCFKKPTRHIHINKEVEIVNVTAGKITEIILKNINTGVFSKEYLKTLEFSIQDTYNSTISYEINSCEEFIRWLLVIKTRMHTVDKWNKDELLESIRR